jgi:hypothetical protein
MATTATGQAIALNYGYCWITGQRLQYRVLQNTNNDHLDWTRVGMWGLGEGEMDGCQELWDSGLQRLLYTSENDDPTAFHFHRGCDAVIGSGAAPVSSGPDQGVDGIWTWLPPGVQPLHYNRIAYYALFLKLVINNPQGSISQENPDFWADLNPVGLWRGIRCRLFDATGTMTGYAFTTNPAWHFVDIILRRKVMPEYNIDLSNGPDDLSVGARKRFDWSAIFAAASYFDEILPNGNRRFEASYSFSQQTSLQAILTQVLQVSRSYMKERSGQIGLYPDQPRGSVFTFSRKNADSFSANDADLHNAANRYVANFRDLLIPSAADVVSISAPDNTNPTVTTLNPHPFAAGDRIVIGGTGTKYDTNWVVATVPNVDAAYTMTLISRGSNYPSFVGAGGKIGLLYSRFQQRAPEFNHHRNQLAKGAIGLDLPRQRNKVKVTTDFATSTFDQVARISYYQRARALGPDAVPYVTPIAAELTAPLFAVDEAGSGAVAIEIEPGDHITVDDTLNATYAGEYEVLTITPQLAGSSANSGDSIARPSIAGSVRFTLGPYSDANFFDTSNPDEAGWDDVPGSQPGNDSNFTTIDLEDGQAAFFSGSGADSSTFDMPSTGFNPANLLAWCSPQGHVTVNAHLHYIRECQVDPTRLLHMIYDDGSGTRWNGDVSFAALTWRSINSVRTFTQGGCSFAELTLAGGEKVCFGQGVIAPSGAAVIPTGYVAVQSMMLAFPYSAGESGHPAHGFRAYVGTDNLVHHDYWDGSNNHWEGSSQFFFFGYLNNKGTVTKTANGWISIPLSTGKTFLAGGWTILDARCAGVLPPHFPPTSLPTILTGGKLPLPPGYDATTLEVMTGANSFQINDNDCHGQRECYVDGDLNALTSFEDGEGHVWYGSSGTFGVISDTPN